MALLVLTVWIIYTCDHLLDARSIKGAATSDRHRFHQHYFKGLLYCVCAAILINFTLLFFIRTQLLVYGVVLALMVGFYLAIQRRFFLFKEIFVACLYTAGVVIPAAAAMKHPLNFQQSFLIAGFSFIALLNLYLFSWMSRHEDESDHLPSLVARVQHRLFKLMMMTLFFLSGGVMIVGSILSDNLLAYLTLLAMTLVLFVLFLLREKASVVRNYRVIGDAVFFIPVIYLLWAL